jgi:hypothetical protein
MNAGYKHLTEEQRPAAVQRLTALWAFTESGLGGIMHALQIPFTGLVVGGMAVIIISMIAEIANKDLKQVLKSAVIVLIVKAMVSPYTPFPAYIAVSFQAVLGYALFNLFSINFFSILLLSTIAMLESAIQKLLILTLFFGKSFWKAMDEMMAFIAKQFGVLSTSGSQRIVGIYLLIYIVGGVFIAWVAYKTIKGFSAEKDIFTLDNTEAINKEIFKSSTAKRKNIYNKLWVMIFLLIVLSVVLFVFSDDTKQGWVAVVKTISWTMSAVLIWFMIVTPLFTKLIQKFLQKKQSRYSDEVLKTLSFLPVLQQLTGLAWKKSKGYKGLKRWHFFVSALIHWSLTYSDPATTELSSKKPL